jgi:hypothetical protein
MLRRAKLATVVLALLCVIGLSIVWLRNGGFAPQLQIGFLETADKAACLQSSSDIPSEEVLSNPTNMLHWLVETDSTHEKPGRASRKGPRWENWCMKSDVGFDPSISGNRRPKYLFSWLRPDSEVRSLSEFPMVQADITNISNPNRQGKEAGFIKTESNQVAAVLFNQPAAEVLYESSLSLGESSWKPPQFPKGAVIVKAIWDLPAWRKGTKGHWFIDGIRLWIPTPPPPDPIKITRIANAKAERTFPPQDASSELRITKSRTSSCEEILKDTTDEDCLHWHPITAWNIAAHVSVNKNDQQQQCANQGCSAILVGFHVMAKSGPGVDDWTFMTFWLVQGKTENYSLPAPWRYFTSNAVNSPRGQLSTNAGDENNLCFNPYLESRVIRPNGNTSNCVDCHRFAAYRAGFDYKQIAGSGSTATLSKEYFEKLTLFAQGNCLGARPLDQQDAGRIAAATKDYIGERNHPSTNRVWSIVTKLLSINSPTVKPVANINQWTCDVEAAGPQ